MEPGDDAVFVGDDDAHIDDDDLNDDGGAADVGT